VQERNAQNKMVNEFSWGLPTAGGIGHLLDLNQGGTHYSYLYDGKGNVTGLLDRAEQVATTYQYDPFGIPLAVLGSLNQPMQFSTKPYDAETGLSYYGFRFYSPHMGRWLTRDPLGELGGLNLYGFAENNPVNRIDPFGLSGSWTGSLPGYFPVVQQTAEYYWAEAASGGSVLMFGTAVVTVATLPAWVSVTAAITAGAFIGTTIGLSIHNITDPFFEGIWSTIDEIQRQNQQKQRYKRQENHNNNCSLNIDLTNPRFYDPSWANYNGPYYENAKH